jgi:hypothetical protein
MKISLNLGKKNILFIFFFFKKLSRKIFKIIIQANYQENINNKAYWIKDKKINPLNKRRYLLLNRKLKLKPSIIKTNKKKYIFQDIYTTLYFVI